MKQIGPKRPLVSVGGTKESIFCAGWWHHPVAEPAVWQAMAAARPTAGRNLLCL